jgi:hypothetical protein
MGHVTPSASKSLHWPLAS